MDSDILFSIGLLLFLLVLGTFFSAAEMAFSALNKARLKSMLESGNKRAGLVLKLHERFDEVLSTLLISNNTVAITSATVGAVLFIRLINEDYGPLVSGIVVTIVVVVFTDILPKSIAKQAPEKVAMFVSPILRLLMGLLKPITYLLVRWQDRLGARMIKEEDNAEEERSLRGQELLYMVEEAENDGAINEEDSLLISNAIEFNDLKAEDILTPRVNIVGIPKGAGVQEMVEIFVESGYSRLPVYEESLDKIDGCVHIRDLLKCMADENGEPQDMALVITPPVYTVPSTRVRDLLQLLQREKSHLAIVIDEYGGTEGLVTMEDILETLVGDIYDENDEVIEAFEVLGENLYRVDCTADIDKMFTYFDMDESEAEASTVGGWIMDRLGRIPEVGDSFIYEKLTVTVMEADQRRAEVCHIQVDAPPPQTDAQ